MNRLKTIGKIFIFIGIFTGILFVLNIIFKAKWIDTTFPTTSAFDGFYDEPKDSIDVVYLGSSHIMSGVSPVQIYQETGLTGYTCGSTKLSVPSAYLYLKEAIRTQHPSVVVMDASRIFKAYKNTYYEEDTRRSLDYVAFSKEKLEVASTLMEGDDRQNLVSYALPLIRYHSRWSDLKKEDFTYMFMDKHMALKGQSVSFNISKFALPDNFLDVVQEDEGYAIDYESIDYFEKIVETCKENNITLILVKIPCYSWNKTKHEIATDLAQSYGIPFVDYCTADMLEEIDFVSTKDFQDEGDHLNSFGAAKISKHLGQYIRENYISGEEHTETVVSEWEEDAAYYNILMENARLDCCNNLIDYLDMLDNEHYIAAISARFDAGYCITPEVIQAMRRLGLVANLEGRYKASYSAIIDGGMAVDEGIDLEEEVSLYYQNEKEDFTIDVLSRGSEAGNLSSILINDEECSGDLTGLNFAVYDKRIGEVVSKKRFNTHSKEYHYGSELQSESVRRNFFDLLQNENYVAFIETKGSLTEKQFEDLSQWVNHNSNYEMKKKEDCCTAIICKAGEIIAFKQGTDVKLSYEDAEADLSVLMHGVRKMDKEFASIKVNGEGKSKNETGINVVVCDRRSGSVVCRKTF